MSQKVRADTRRPELSITVTTNQGLYQNPSDFTGIPSQKKLMLQNDSKHFMHVSLRNTKLVQLKKNLTDIFG